MQIRHLGCAAAFLLAPLFAQDPPKPDPRPEPKAAPAIKLIAAPAAPAQGPDQETLKQRRTEKLKKPVFQCADWLLDYDAARQQAKEQGKLLLVYFTRSYAG